MASSDDRFKYESLEDTETIVKYMAALQEGFESGNLMFSSDGKRLLLKPKGLINLTVEAKRKNEDVKITIKLRWTEEPATSNGKSPLSIKVLDE